MVLYGITLAPLVEELRDADPALLSPFYANDVAFYRLTWRCAAQLILLMDRGPNKGYFPELSKTIFIEDNPEEKEAAKKEFDQGRPKSKLCRWQPLHGGQFGDQGGARGVGADQGGGMGLLGPHPS